MDNYRKHQALKKVELEQLENVLSQYGERVDFHRYEDVDNPVLIVQLKHGWVGDVEFTSIWLDKDGDICCEAQDVESGDNVEVNVYNEISYGFIGYLIEEIINVGRKEGKTLDPCRHCGSPFKTSLLEWAERADHAVLDYLERHDYDGNLVQNAEELLLYLGGMEFHVESLFVDSNCNPSVFGTSYEMEADIRINRLGSEDNLRKIIDYCENN